MTRGVCLCGTVQYEIAGPFQMMMHCHCSMCRKHHGGSFATFVSADRWRQDEMVLGPDLAGRPGFAEAGLYHFEMFVALAGKRDELLREREMENAYLAEVGRPITAIFVRESGAEWDSFTIGAYRSWTHFAERDRIPPEKSAAAARKAGFESDAHIGAYMRSLIALHHDTLTTPVR